MWTVLLAVLVLALLIEVPYWTYQFVNWAFDRLLEV